MRRALPARLDAAVQFDRDWYLAAYPDVAAAQVDPFGHYEQYGKAEGRHPTPPTEQEEKALGFDRVWYGAAYPDVTASGLSPFCHWLQTGKAEGRAINGDFTSTSRQLAVLAKNYHYKDLKTECSKELKVREASFVEEAADFESAQYWRERYRKGGNSGAGSYGRLAEFKAEVINAFVHERKITDVIEFGCGDGAQLMLATYPNYVGFDVSDESVELCRAKFLHDATKKFQNAANWSYEAAGLVLSLDVIFHLIEDDVFHDYMRRLFFSSKRYVIIYSSNYDGGQIAAHVKHRAFSDWIDVYQADFKLIRHVPNRWPLIEDAQNESFADFFIFERVARVRHDLPGHLLVSLTSYRKRFPTLELTLRRILQQSVQPDTTVLWVSTEDRMHLPQGVLDLQRCGLEICETKDTRSYKKIIPALERYPNSFIITVDDDTVYPLNLVESLVENYRCKTEVLCRRAHRIELNENGLPRPYSQWQFETASEDDANLFATGVGGVLYPPRSLAPEVVDEVKFSKLAPLSDDLWLFWMTLRAGSRVRRVGHYYPLLSWPGCDENGLWVTQNAIGGNDAAIEALINHFGWPLSVSGEKLSSAGAKKSI